MMDNIFQIDAIANLIRDNRYLFHNKPIVEISDTSDIQLRFKGITRQITCVFERSGTIDVCAYYRNRYHDIVAEFALSAERTPTGRFRCRLCLINPGNDNESPPEEYETCEQLWVEHCLKPLAEWTHENFTNDAMLCLCRDRGSTAAFVCSGVEKERIMARRDFFKAVSVVTNNKASLLRQ